VAFLAAVAADARADLPRLAYADWLDECGDRPDDADHAAFVREQVAASQAARAGQCPNCRGVQSQWLDDADPEAAWWAFADTPFLCPGTCRRRVVEAVVTEAVAADVWGRRADRWWGGLAVTLWPDVSHIEIEAADDPLFETSDGVSFGGILRPVWAESYAERFRAGGPVVTAPWQFGRGLPSPVGREGITVTRGFPGRVACTLPVFARHGATLSALPLDPHGVWLVDRWPQLHDSIGWLGGAAKPQWAWLLDEPPVTGRPPWALPRAIFRHLRGPVREFAGFRYRSYPSPAVAMRDLSQACLTWARRRVLARSRLLNWRHVGLRDRGEES
jgi:uncharacterized protein (TIGR02996 family)